MSKLRSDDQFLALGATSAALAAAGAIFVLYPSIMLLTIEYTTLICSGVLSILSFAFAVVAFGLGVGAIVKNKKNALCAFILLGAACVLALCSLGIPGIGNIGIDNNYNNVGSTIKALNSVAGILFFVSMILTAIYYIVCTENKDQIADEDNAPIDVSAALDRITELNGLRESGEISEEEFSAKKQKVISCALQKPVKKRNKAKISVKKALCCTLIPILIVIICVSAVVPSTYLVISDKLYDDLLVAMQNVEWYSSDYHEPNSNLEQYFDQLPENYLFTKRYKRQYNEFKKNRQIIENNEDYISPAQLRNAEKRVIQQKDIPVFNFNYNRKTPISEKLILDVDWRFEYGLMKFTRDAHGLRFQAYPVIGDSVDVYVSTEAQSDGGLLIKYYDESRGEDVSFELFEFGIDENMYFTMTLFSYIYSEFFEISAYEY